MLKLKNVDLAPAQQHILDEMSEDVTVSTAEILRTLASWGHEVSYHTVADKRPVTPDPPVSERKKETNAKIAELLERSAISIDQVGRAEKIKVYQGFSKNKDGEPEVVDMVSISLSPSWDEGPKWPLIQQSDPVIVRQNLPKKFTKLGESWKTAVILPDIQAGFYFDGKNQLIPTHDERAIGVALQIVAAEDPDLVVMVGDGLDLPELSKFRLTPAFQRTLQPTIDWTAQFGAKLRAAAPNARIIWLAGNHEERMPNYILDNAIAAFGIKRGEAPQEWPVFSVPFLCRFEENGIEFLPGYPANEFYINDRIKVIHGHKVNSTGSTVHKYLDTERVSTISGHVHRIEKGHRTRRTRNGSRTIMAASPGCLARVDGPVPSTKGATDLSGIPLTSYEDWQQGLAVVRYEEGDGRFIYTDIPIFDGWAMWRDKEFVA